MGPRVAPGYPIGCHWGGRGAPGQAKQGQRHPKDTQGMPEGQLAIYQTSLGKLARSPDHVARLDVLNLGMFLRLG